MRLFIKLNACSCAGESLIAVNPMKPVSLYGEEMVWQYHNVEVRGCTDRVCVCLYIHKYIPGQQELSEFRSLTPHIFAVGETALRNMLEHSRPQSVIVSGESGAGKVGGEGYRTCV